MADTDMMEDRIETLEQTVLDIQERPLSEILADAAKTIEGLGKLCDEKDRRIAEFEAAIKDARNIAARQVIAGRHSQDWTDAKAWLESDVVVSVVGNHSIDIVAKYRVFHLINQSTVKANNVD